jgi:hypothetical protein
MLPERRKANRSAHIKETVNLNNLGDKRRGSAISANNKKPAIHSDNSEKRANFGKWDEEMNEFSHTHNNARYSETPQGAHGARAALERGKLK